MANTNVSFGLRPLSKIGSSYNTTGTTEYRIAAGNANRIYQGMPVIPTAAGVIDDLQAAAGGTVSILGVFYGCEYVSSTTGEVIFSNNWPGSGADTNHPVKAFVYDDPNQLFVIAVGDNTGAATEALVRADVFLNCPLINGNSGNNTTGISTATADLNNAAATASLALRIVGIQEDAENSDFTAVGIPLIVRINNHFNAPNGSIAQGTVSTLGV
jgi:hypothetical protein